jgi:5'-nucleotidase
MKILLTNDDGINAPGLFALYEEIKKLGEVVVVAPDSEKSAVGHAITISDPLRVSEFEKNGKFFGYAVNGTPADCVKLAIKSIIGSKPDLVASGINLGQNTATNVIYSGTVSAATEGTISGIPSIAFSLTTFRKTDFSYASKFARKLSGLVIQKGLPKGTLLNVNIPPLPENEIEGVVITRQGKGRFEEYFDKRTDPTGRIYYWLAGKEMKLDTEDDVDDVVVSKKKISITPIHYDLTNYSMLEELRKWNIEK